jgi:hypothetical protein
VVEFLRGRDLEAADVDALRVHPAHDVPDGAVLAAGVEGLQAHEHAVGALGGQPRLVVGEQGDAGPQQFDAVLLLPDLVGSVGRVEVVREVNGAARSYPQRLDELGDALRSLVRHLSYPASVEVRDRLGDHGTGARRRRHRAPRGGR